MRHERLARVADIFTVLVIASVAIALGLFVWRLFDAFSSPSPEASSESVSPRTSGGIGAILALAPFGKSDGSSAPQSSLALQLRGILLTNPKSSSTAMIAPPNGAPAAYAIGQPVPGGAIVEDIAIDRVLIRNNGRLERLDLPRVSTASASPAPSGFGQSSPAIVPLSAIGLAMAPAGIGLFEAVPASPAPGGYRVGTPLSPRAQAAGLQPGDLIERVNGLVPDALTADRGALAAILASGSAELTVSRGGRRLSLPYSLR